MIFIFPSYMCVCVYTCMKQDEGTLWYTEFLIKITIFFLNNIDQISPSPSNIFLMPSLCWSVVLHCELELFCFFLFYYGLSPLFWGIFLRSVHTFCFVFLTPKWYQLCLIRRSYVPHTHTLHKEMCQFIWFLSD